MRLLCLCLLMSIPAASALAADLDKSPFGVNGLKFEHNRSNSGFWAEAETRAELMKGAGMAWDRDGFSWGWVEPEKGKFEWEWADKSVNFCRDKGINFIGLLSGCSAWSGGKPPTDDAERAAFANFVYQCVNRYKDRVKVWEIWNEPNIPAFWPEPNVKDYTLLLKEAYKAAKKADPNCIILAANTSGPDLTFIKGIHENGGWDYFDVICTHPYSMSGGPIPQHFDKILRMVNAYAASTGKPKPHWITEMGWTSANAREDRDQAIYLFQSYVMAMANGVEKLCWFDLEDWAEKWGVVRAIDIKDAKPAYHTYALMTKHFGSPGAPAKFQGYLEMAEGVACYVFTKPDGKALLAVWCDREMEHSLYLPGMKGLAAVDVFGRPVKIGDDGEVATGATPIIVAGVDPDKIGRVSPKLNPYLEKPSQNLLNNGSLNEIHGSQPGWWNPGRFFGSDNKGTFATSDDGRGGSKCVSISKSTSPAAWDACPTPVDSGAKYRLTGWIKSKDATGKSRIAIFWYSGNMWTYVGEASTESVTGTRDWARFSVAGVAPKEATFARVNLISEDNTGIVWFDDIDLVQE